MCLPNAEEGRECVQAIKRLRGEALSRVSVKIWQVYNRPRNKQCTAAELYAPGVNHVLLVGVFNAIRVFRCALERCLAVLKTNTMTAGVFPSSVCVFSGGLSGCLLDRRPFTGTLTDRSLSMQLYLLIQIKGTRFLYEPGEFDNLSITSLSCLSRANQGLAQPCQSISKRAKPSEVSETVSCFHVECEHCLFDPQR